MNPLEKIHESWQPLISSLLAKPEMKEFSENVLTQCSFQPQVKDIFNVFSMPLNSIKVIVLGMDPYPTPGDACGYSFVPGRDKIPVSLRNIYKESGAIDIKSWIPQGVFLLNSALTVETGSAGSHIKYWKDFTKAIISFISKSNPTIWILWGAKAKTFGLNIANPLNTDVYNLETIAELPILPENNCVMTAPHPAAEAYAGGKAGFFGCNHFIKINKILKVKKEKEILW